jgi:hypothetical protein
LEFLLQCLYLILDPFEAIFDCGPDRPGSSPHGEVEALGDFFTAGAGLLRGREAGRRSSGAPSRNHRSECHKLSRLFIHRTFGIVESCKLLDIHHLSSLVLNYTPEKGPTKRGLSMTLLTGEILVFLFGNTRITGNNRMVNSQFERGLARLSFE